MSSIWYEFVAFCTEIAYDIVNLPMLYQTEPKRFWLLSAALLLILSLLVWLICSLVRRKKKKSKQQDNDNSARSFVPIVEHHEDDTPSAIIHPLPERIINCGEQLNRDAARRILLNAPKTLADIVAAYERCSPGVRANLTQLVRETRMLESYSLHLNEDGFPLGVLVDAWNYFPDNNVLRSFVELLGHKDEQIQMNGVRLLSAIHEPKMLSLLVPALVQPNRYVTARVADVFLSMPMQSAALLAYMLPEVGDPQKLSMLEVIAQAGVEFPIENVLQCLKNKDFRVRAAACAALGASLMTDTVPQLIFATTDKQWQVRAAAAKALGQIGDMRGMSALQALVNDKEGWVAATAKEALNIFYDFTGIIS